MLDFIHVLQCDIIVGRKMADEEGGVLIKCSKTLLKQDARDIGQ